MAKLQGVSQQRSALLQQKHHLLQQLLQNTEEQLQELPASDNSIINLDDDSDDGIKQELVEHAHQLVEGHDDSTEPQATLPIPPVPEQRPAITQNTQPRKIEAKRPETARQQFPDARPASVPGEGDQVTRELIIRVSAQFPNIIKDPTSDSFLELHCPDPECRANSRRDRKYLAGLHGLGLHVAAHDPEGYGRMKHADLLPSCIKRHISVKEMKGMLRKRTQITQVFGKRSVPDHFTRKSRERKKSAEGSRTGRNDGDGGVKRSRPAQVARGSDSVETGGNKSFVAADPKVAEMAKD